MKVKTRKQPFSGWLFSAYHPEEKYLVGRKQWLHVRERRRRHGRFYGVYIRLYLVADQVPADPHKASCRTGLRATKGSFGGTRAQQLSQSNLSVPDNSCLVWSTQYL